MRVLFDAYWWVEGPLSNQMVQREFIRTWLRDYPGDEAVLVVPQAHLPQARASAPAGAMVIGTRARPHAVAMALAVPVLARRRHADVAVTHNFTPLAGPAVVFVHDVLFQTNPEWFTPAERAYFAGIPLLARRARALTTSSANEARRIRAANPALRAVHPVGLTISPELATISPRRPADLPPVTDFVLTVGRLNVRKNLAATIAGALAGGAVSPDRPLVVVGESDGRSAQLGPAADTARRDGAVVFLRRVDDAELAWLYAHTGLFVFLSLDEGYGLPPVEAAHFGAPVLASDLALFHETLGPRARFVDPRDDAAIAAAITRELADPAPRRPADSAAGVAERWSASVRSLREVAVAAIGGGSTTADRRR